MAGLFGGAPRTKQKTQEEARQEEERRRRSLLARSAGGTLLTSPTGLETSTTRSYL